MVFNNFDLSMFESFSHQNLKYRLYFQIKVEKIRVSVVYLDAPDLTFGIWYENR